MSSTSEIGHAKNLANFKRLPDYINEIGSIYNPANASLTAPAIMAKYTACNASFTALKMAEATAKNSTNVREIEFLKLDTYINDISNHFLSLDVPAQTTKDVRSIVKKYKGSLGKQTKADAGKKVETPSSTPANSTTIATPEIPGTENAEVDEKTISHSQQSYDNKFSTAQTLLFLLMSIPTYSPNEPELQTTNFQTFLQGLSGINDTANTDNTALIKARNERNKLFYTNADSLYNIALKTKRYMRQLLIKNNKELFNKVNTLQFVKITPRKKTKKK